MKYLELFEGAKPGILGKRLEAYSSDFNKGDYLIKVIYIPQYGHYIDGIKYDGGNYIKVKIDKSDESFIVIETGDYYLKDNNVGFKNIKKY